MSGNETTLANMINNLRSQTALPNLPSNRINVGVAQFHARDMAEYESVTFVASDGEDPFRRITCSGGSANAFTGVIAVGQGSDPIAVVQAIQADFSAFSTLFNPSYTNSLSVGYNEGYWLIILQ